MQIPARIPGLRWLTIVWGVYAAIWISLEGDLRQVVALGVCTMLVGLGHGMQRRWAGRPFPAPGWLARMAATGLLLGAGSSILTLFFMALKTGLHAHGPEFTADELAWVMRQLPLWAGVGGMTGLGLGLLSLAMVGD
ncbi:MAG: hypothetical protein IAE79_05430 [Anaerolinea sp.]|nr:hypothetical protein [Anaerolinea sp.]